MRAKAAAVLVVALLSLSGVLPIALVLAATPTSGEVSTTAPTALWTGSTAAANPTVGLATSFDPSTCQSAGYCDLFTLNLNIPSSLGATYPGYFLNVSMTWASPSYDYDLYVYHDGNLMGSGTLGSGTDHENVFISKPAPGTYQIYADNWLVPPGYPYSGNATLGLTLPPYSFPTRSGTYSSDTAGKSAGSPYIISSDLRLVGAQQGGCGPENSGTGLCSQDVEPSIKLDQFGTIYASAINGVGSGTDFWRSTNGGTSFQYLGEPDGAQSATASGATMGGLGGGDDDLAVGTPFVLLNQNGVVVNSTGRVYSSSLWLGSVTVSNSINQGSNWIASQTPFPADDRQWTAASGASGYYVSFNELVSEVAGVTNLVALQSTDGGATFANGAYIGKAVGGNQSTYQGPIEVGPDGTLYDVFTPPATNQLMLAKCPAPCNLPLLPISTTSSPFQVTRIFDGPSNMTTDNVFPQLAVDSSGNLYAAWSDGRSIYMMASSDGGSTWTLPVKVNSGADTATALEPWMQAGDPGRVGFMWYGTNVTSNSPDNFTAFASAQW